MTTEAAEKLDEDHNEVRAGQRIDALDAKALRWYFSDPVIAGVGAGSTMGVMLERAAVMATRLIPCQRCGGSRDGETPGTGYCPRAGGNYRTALRTWWKQQAKQMGRRLVPTIADAEEWKRLGVNAVISGEAIGLELPDHMLKRCMRCEGTGMVQRRRNNHSGPQTVKATGSSVHGNPDAMHWVDEQGLAQYAAIGRKLDRVRERSLKARVALSLYYGPNGGSSGALWVITQRGAQFLAETENTANVPAEALMQNEREQHRVTPTVSRTLMFSAIARECAVIWDEACAVWAQVNS